MIEYTKTITHFTKRTKNYSLMFHFVNRAWTMAGKNTETINSWLKNERFCANMIY